MTTAPTLHPNTAEVLRQAGKPAVAGVVEVVAKHKTREAWLRAFAKGAGRQYTARGLNYPADLRIGCGWLGKRYLGIAYKKEASSVGAVEVTVSMKQDDPILVAGTLTHELIHACGVHGHKADFAGHATALGLAGKPTMAGWDDVKHGDLPEWAGKLITRLGPYPKGTLEPGTGKPKDKVRMIKAECQSCGMVIRLARKWLKDDLRCPDPACGDYGELSIG